MMRPANDISGVYLCREPVDFRKGIATLSILVESQLELNPFSEHLFVFCNKKRDAVKILYWEKTGFCLWHKRLEKARFAWPKKMSRDAIIMLSGQQLNWLLDGYNLMQMQGHEVLRYDSVL